MISWLYPAFEKGGCFEHTLVLEGFHMLEILREAFEKDRSSNSRAVLQR